MKKIATLLIAAIVFFGCQKEPTSTLSGTESLKLNYKNNVSAYLKARLSEEDFKSLDLVSMKISAYQNGDSNFIKIPFQRKSIKTDFIAIQSDTVGICKIATIVHFEIPDTSLPAYKKITINSLSRAQTWNFDFTKNNNRNSTTSQKDLIAEIPLMEDVTVIAYLPKTGGFTQFAFDNILFLLNPNGASAMPGGGLGMPAVGVLSGGFGDYGNYSDPTSGGIKKLEFERPESEPAADINRIFNCFNLLPDAGANYQITIEAQIPILSDPMSPYNLKLEPGHSFITITKKNGGSSVTKSYGFYPNSGYKSVADPYGMVLSKVVNNSEHKFNSSITKSMSQAQFNIVKSTSIANASKHYCLANYNCTDFALAAWNSAFSSAPDKIVLPQFAALYPATPFSPPIPVTINNSPQMLFQYTKGLCGTGDNYNPPPGVSAKEGVASKSPGECN
ncbi:hypothetical protein BH11BAC5_BH11BAC5_43270 [soil metagenome]